MLYLSNTNILIEKYYADILRLFSYLLCCDVYSDNVMCWLLVFLAEAVEENVIVTWGRQRHVPWLASNSVASAWTDTFHYIGEGDHISVHSFSQFCLSFGACSKAFTSCGFKVDASWKQMYIATENT